MFDDNDGAGAGDDYYNKYHAIPQPQSFSAFTL